MASNYGLNFGFRRSDESVRACDGFRSRFHSGDASTTAERCVVDEDVVVEQIPENQFRDDGFDGG